MIHRTSSIAFVLTALALVGGCQLQPGSTQSTFSTSSQPQMTANALAIAQDQASEFDRDRQYGGMSAVIRHIQWCYARMSGPPVNQIGLRYCLVFDWFAYRFTQEVNRQQPGFGDLPFFQQQTVAARDGRYGPLAGLSDPDVLGGYMAQGASTIFLVMASRSQFERHNQF